MARVAGLFDTRLPLVSRALPKLNQRLRRSIGALRMPRERPAGIDWVRRMALRPRRLHTGRGAATGVVQDGVTPTVGTAMQNLGATSGLVSAGAGLVAPERRGIPGPLWALPGNHARVSGMRLMRRSLQLGGMSGGHTDKRGAVGASVAIRARQQGLHSSGDGSLMRIGAGEPGGEQALRLDRRGPGFQTKTLQSPSGRMAWWHPERGFLRRTMIDARRSTRGLIGAPLTSIGGTSASVGGAAAPRVSRRQASQPQGWGSFAPSFGGAGDMAGELAASTVGSRALSSYAPTEAHAQGHRGGGVSLTGEIIIDGRQLGMVIAREQTRQANLPATRGSAIEAGAIPLYLNNSGSF